ncbi:MAG: hypothetical protein Q9M91_04170 [Candidatus Dojkabacteria bacterium]|nr:hypothetical protein [Candidatus Dojkabacteria bacterium]MDQ7021010.1 hypothetical protein [Candidatus Dojkabacteria bacterium]
MELHYIQAAILLELGQIKGLTFSGFKIPTELNIEADKFNYHLKTLVKLKLVNKKRRRVLIKF